MNHSETARLLAAIAAYNNRTIGEADVEAWQSALDDIELTDALAAVKKHYRTSIDWIMPLHVRTLVDEILKERSRPEPSKWAPGQWGVPKEEAPPEITKEHDRLALAQLTDEVAALVTRVRAMLPGGSRETLKPRTVAWEKEHAAFLRTQSSKPNPLYKPQARTFTASEPVGEPMACDWHADGGFGFQWDCRDCNPGHPAYAGVVQ